MTYNEIINCTTIIRASKKLPNDKIEMHTATSFFAKYDDTIYLITNKHVLSYNPNVELMLKCEDCITGKIQNNVITKFTQGNDTKYHNDYDIAAIPIEPVIQDYTKNNMKIINSIININEIECSSANFTDVENVISCGYPNGFRDEVNNFPLVVSGITSSSINNNFNGRKLFVANLHSYNGSSGSPVFLNSDTYMLVGIVCATYPLPDADELLNTIPLEYMGLYKNVCASVFSQVIKADVLIDLLRNY